MKASRVPISELEPSIGFWLRLASGQITQVFQKKVEMKCVTLSEFEVLRLTEQFGVTSGAELGELVGLSKGATSKLLTRLVDKGFVARFNDEDDGRGYLLQLTVAGKALVAALVGIAEQADEEYVGHLSKNEKSEFLRTLKKVAAR
ncbi:MAG: MarR family transcriptional regulator [Candidatus Obscuribacterales bacterium]